MSIPELVERYRRDGYISLEGIYPLAQMEELRRITDGFVERSREVTEHSDMFDLEPGHTAEHPRLRRLKNPVRFDEAYDRCLREPKLLDIVAQLISPGIRIHSTKLNLKSGEFGS